MSGTSFKDSLINGTGKSRRIIIIAAVLIAAATILALIIPALTMSTKTYCGMEEHQHDSGCYSKVAVCGLEEAEGHAHTDECYDENGELICGLEESEGHSHSDECYEEQMTCTVAEHTHGLACYSNPEADLETEEQWTESFKDVDVDDEETPVNVKVIEIAKSQLGYTESDSNYEVDSDGETKKGITRYGQWYGDDYGDWCAMFCGFCIRYAGIEEEEYPIDSNCDEWIKSFKKIEKAAKANDKDSKVKIYHKYDSSYVPKSGDLIFYDFDDNNVAEHIGFVYKVKDEEGKNVISPADGDDKDFNDQLTWADDKDKLTIVAIEGNHEGKVEYVDREAASDYILGFGEMPQTCTEDASLSGNQYKKVFEGKDFTVTATYTDKAKLPKGTTLEVEEITSSSEKYEQYYDKAVKQYKKENGSKDDVKVEFARFFDITFMYKGKEIEPSADVDIKITYDKAVALEDKDNAQTFHFDGKKTEIVDTKTTSTGDEAKKDKDAVDTFKFSSDSFSVYGTAVMLSAVQTYYKKVDEIDTTDANYIIVNTSMNKALNRTTGSTQSGTSVSFTAVTGHDGYYTATGVVNNNKWAFGSTSNSSTTIKSGNYYLSMTKSYSTVNVVSTSSTNITRAYSNGTWTLSRTGNQTTYYLSYANNVFTRTQTTGDSTKIIILKEVSEDLSGGDEEEEDDPGTDTPGGDTPSSDVTKPTYPAYIDPSGPKSGTEEYKEDKDIKVSYASDDATSDIEKQFNSQKFSLTPVSGTAGVVTGENYDKLFDGKTSTKYCVNPSNGEVYVIFEAEVASQLSQYSLTTANDSATTNRLPSGWTIYGSNASSAPSESAASWKELATVAITGMDNENYKEYNYYSTDTGKYKYFKIVFKTDHMIQFSELSIYMAGKDDGKVLTDKSVVYKDDDYSAFDKYDDYTFGVTLSALAQVFQLAQTDVVKIPVDVVFVLDVSGSMENNNTSEGITRTKAVVNAVNNAMSKIMTENTQNRAGIVMYSSGGSQLLKLDHYTTSGTNYLDYTSGDIYTNSNLKYSDGTKVTRTNGETGGFTQGHGTYTQYGIALGANILTDNKDTTYTQTIGEGTAQERKVTVTRQPVIILLSDGDPTHCTNNYTNVTAGKHYGSGVYTNSNNKGIHGYYTILSANYYKGTVSKNYYGKSSGALMYTIGMGINETGTDDMSKQSYTGDHYKRAVLNPNASNIEALSNNGKNQADTADMLKALLSSSYSQTTVTTGSTNYTNLGGNTTSNVPVIKPNPYASGYSYADGAFFGNLGTTQLNEIFNTIIQGAISSRTYGLLLREGNRVELNDTIGDGMEVKGVPILRYGGKNYKPTSEDTVSFAGGIYNNVTTYKYDYDYVATDGSGFKADLNNIIVQKQWSSYTGKQNIRFRLDANEVPTYTPGNNGTASWYYEQLPARLIYQVGLSENAEKAVKSLKAGETLTYYTNKWSSDNGSAAYSEFLPTDDNPYYATEDNDSLPGYHPYTTAKIDGGNATGTDLNSIKSIRNLIDTTEQGVPVVFQDIKNTLGNNGKLTFTTDTTTLDVEKVWNGIEEDDMPDEIQVQLYKKSASENEQTVGEPVALTKANEWKYTFRSLAIKDEAGNPYQYRVEELTGGQYTVSYSTSSAVYSEDLKTIEPITVTNTGVSYELPETGGTGTLPFTLAGLFLLVCAGAIGFRRYIRGGGLS